MSDQMNLPGILNATSSPESESGAMPSAKQAGQMINRSGPAAAPASRSQPLVERGDLRTTDIFGLSFSGSSESVALTLSLANKLADTSERLGSTLYRMTWREKRLPSGRLHFRLQASVHRTLDSGFTGWPTARANDGTGSKIPPGRQGGESLKTTANLSGWPTAKATDMKGGGQIHRALTRAHLVDHVTLTDWSMVGWKTPRANDKGGINPEKTQRKLTDYYLPDQAKLTYWPTPQAQMSAGMKPEKIEWSPGGKPRNKDTGRPMQTVLTDVVNLAGPVRLTANGKELTGLAAGTVNGGQLNPALSRWLMGLPEEWDVCGVMAMQSLRRKRKHS